MRTVHNPTVIFMVACDDTNMTRFITAKLTASNKSIVGRLQRALKSSKCSDQGNAALRRINPSWDAHREAFMKSNKFTVVHYKPHWTCDYVSTSIAHQVAWLNRYALSKADPKFKEGKALGNAQRLCL